MNFTVEFPARLDAFLSDQYEDVSRGQLQKSIKEGHVDVNGSVIKKPAYQLKESDEVTLRQDLHSTKDESEVLIEPVNLQLQILYEDDHCMVIHKPAGYAVHPASGMPEGEATILAGVAHLFAGQSIPFSPDAVLVHRLDKETTGCLLIAKDADSHHLLQKQFEVRTVKKKYLALVAGIPDPPAATIDAPIGRNLTDRTKMSILQTSVSREAKTTYRVVDSIDLVSLLECDLHTGRTHQIRVHLRSIGHSILGDATYESGASRDLTKEYEVQGMCLHSWKLAFQSGNGEEVSVVSDLPEHFKKASQDLGLKAIQA